MFFQPFLNSDNFALRGLGFGVGGTYVNSTGSTDNDAVAELSHSRAATASSAIAPTPRTGATPDNGPHVRGRRAPALAPQAYYSIGSFGLLGEYMNV